MTASFDIVQFNGAQVSYHTSIPYQTFQLPRWNGSHAAPAPGLANNKGYDVTAPQLSHARREYAYSRANANLCDGQSWWPMFITDVHIDIAQSGTTAQSRTTRDFYPHNFVQPAFVLKGQALDQRDYGALTDFVHHAQRNTLINGGKLMQLFVKGGGFNGNHKGKGVRKNGTTYHNQRIRGNHQALLCLGYINQMPRQHQQGVICPTYTFSFLVADMITGPYQEDMVQVVQQQNWVDILKSTQNISTTPERIKENNQQIGKVLANEGNLFGTVTGG